MEHYNRFNILNLLSVTVFVTILHIVFRTFKMHRTMHKCNSHQTVQMSTLVLLPTVIASQVKTCYSSIVSLVIIFSFKKILHGCCTYPLGGQTVIGAACPWVVGASLAEGPCAGWPLEDQEEGAPCQGGQGEAWASGAWLQQDTCGSEMCSPC